jgi:hypothetical protein
LHGVVLGLANGGQAFLEDPKTKKVTAYRVGDSVGDARVERIDTDRVVLRQGGEAFDVLLHDPSKPKPPPPPATPVGRPGVPGQPGVPGTASVPGTPGASVPGAPGPVYPGFPAIPGQTPGGQGFPQYQETQPGVPTPYMPFPPGTSMPAQLPGPTS